MTERAFYIVDVFAEEVYSGNQLAVFVDAVDLSTAGMQTLAREMNYSETTFVSSAEGENGGYDVRIFTPGEEVPFAGHPTLGTAYVIRQFVQDEPQETVRLNMKVGQIPVTAGDDGVLWMQTPEPEFGAVLDGGRVAEVVGVEASDIAEGFPVQVVSTGIPFVIVPLKTLAAVKRARVDSAKLSALGAETGCPLTVFVFCPETYDGANDINARMFAECFGVPEDPATGSANSCLAGYLVEHEYFGDDAVDVRVEQGYEIGRRSLLYLKAKERSGRIGIRVGGKVFPTARGVLL